LGANGLNRLEFPFYSILNSNKILATHSPPILILPNKLSIPSNQLNIVLGLVCILSYSSQSTCINVDWGVN
jgi:hypothetical protein